MQCVGTMSKTIPREIRSFIQTCATQYSVRDTFKVSTMFVAFNNMK